MSVEEVLVVPAAVVAFRGLVVDPAAAQAFLDEVVEPGGQYLPRPIAEADESYRQVIPYVVVRRGDEVFTMTRINPGDARLVGKVSIGIGGHVNPIDGVGHVDGADTTPLTSLFAGLVREWDEEVSTDSQTIAFSPIGLVAFDETAVDRVHVGILFVVDIEAGAWMHTREEGILEGAFVRVADIAAFAGDRLETWSRHALAVIGDLPGA